MARKVVFENDNNILYCHIGVSRFKGCQCIKDCDCHSVFKEEPYGYFTVVRKNKKTTAHETLDEALVRWEYVNSL